MLTIQAMAGGAGSAIFVLASFLFVLSIVVFIHELGHFLVARWCGVTVKAFSLGFGPEIYGFVDGHGTRWRLAWLPLGGYVKFMDDENAASVPSQDAIQNMTPEERAGSFHGKALWQRAAVVAAGPIANFLLAIVLLAMLSTFVGFRVVEPRVDAISAGSPAARAGMKAGDLIVSIDGSQVDSLNDLERVLSIGGSDTIRLGVMRDGKPLSFEVTPEKQDLPDGMGGTVQRGYIGLTSQPRIDQVLPGRPAEKAGFRSGDVIAAIDGKAVATFEDVVKIVSVNAGKQLEVEVQRSGGNVKLSVVPDAQKDPKTGTMTRGTIGISRSVPTEWRKTGPLGGLAYGLRETRFIITSTLGYIGGVITGRQKADQLGGPIRIAEVSGQVARVGIEPLLHLVAVISVSVGLINLFPIPLLDGGHLLFYGIEAIRRRPLSERSQEIGFKIGLAVVLMLMIFATWNDLPIVKRWMTGS